MTAILPLLFLPLFVALTSAANAARSDWSAADRAQLRLLLAAPEAGRIAGGVEIVLEPGWHTYWRTPGEAGVPPMFDFSGSENVAAVEVLYPAPERFDDGASVSLVYKDEVVFPVEITPLDPSRPIILRVDASFGVCREVCIPTQTSSEVGAAPSSKPDALAEARLRRFQPRVPKPAEPGRFDVENISVEGDALLIDVRMPDSSYTDLFAEPPPGWYIGQPRLVARANGVSRYRLALAGRPADVVVSGQEFRFVAVAGGEAIEETVEIR